MSDAERKRFLDRYPIDDTLSDRPPPYLSVSPKTGEHSAFRADHLVRMDLGSDKMLKLRIGDVNVLVKGHRLLPLYRRLCAGEVRELTVSDERPEFAEGPTVVSIAIEKNLDGLPDSPLESYLRSVQTDSSNDDSDSHDLDQGRAGA